MRKQLCFACYENSRGDVVATCVIDGDPLCAACARTAGAPVNRFPNERFPVALSEETSGKSIVASKSSDDVKRCGRPLRDGRPCPTPVKSGYSRCARHLQAAGTKTELAVVNAPEPLQLPAPETIVPQSPIAEREHRVDKLVASEVDLDQVPQDVPSSARPYGRLGELWQRLLTAPSGKAQQVANRDRNHASTTNRHMRLKAEKHGRLYRSKIMGSTLYCWLDGEAQ